MDKRMMDKTIDPCVATGEGIDVDNDSVSYILINALDKLQNLQINLQDIYCELSNNGDIKEGPDKDESKKANPSFRDTACQINLMSDICENLSERIREGLGVQH